MRLSCGRAGTELGLSWDRDWTELWLGWDCAGTELGLSWDRAGPKLRTNCAQAGTEFVVIVYDPIIKICCWNTTKMEEDMVWLLYLGQPIIWSLPNCVR